MNSAKNGFSDRPSKSYERLIAQYVKYWGKITSRQEQAKLNKSLGLNADQSYNLRNNRLIKPVDLETQDKIYKLLKDL